MSRAEKLNYIKKNFLELYAILEKDVPKLIETPEEASASDIATYNNWVAFEAGKKYDFSLYQKLSF